ncbi:hypothetical protein ORI89_07280 [Sphingobacterium sp. UT-1RO-CII-1]|nr:hypothetical protein [Sphingobacterium sp. UT-1RO-CII-1]
MKMKSLFTTILSVLLLSVTLLATAQTSTNTNGLIYNGTSTKFGVMITDVMHFKVALETAELMNLKKNGYIFEIVMVGKLAKEIAENKELKADIEKSEAVGAKLVVCEYALDLFKVDKSKIDKRIEITKNAWLYMFELKDKGYNTLDIQS